MKADCDSAASYNSFLLQLCYRMPYKQKQPENENRSKEIERNA